MIIHIIYDKPIRWLKTHYYGGFHFVEASGQVPTLSSLCPAVVVSPGSKVTFLYLN